MSSKRQIRLLLFFLLCIIILIVASSASRVAVRCLKKYCVCFNAGIKCNKLCQCRDCGNQDVAEKDNFLTSEVTGVEDDNAQAKSEDTVGVPPTKYVKVASMEGRLPAMSPFADSLESFESLPCLPQQYQDTYQMHSIIQGDFLLGPVQSEVEPQYTAEV